MDLSDRTTITDDIRTRLASERKRTGVVHAALLRRATSVPTGLKAQHIDKWLNSYKTANSVHLQFVLNTYAALPSIKMADPAEKVVISRSAQVNRNARRVPIARSKSPYIPMTDMMRKQFADEWKRTGAYMTSVLTLLPPEYDHITIQQLRLWRKTSRKKVRQGDWDCVMEALRSLPDRNSQLASLSMTKKRKRPKRPKVLTSQKGKRKANLPDDAEVALPKACELDGKIIAPNLSRATWLKKTPWKPARTSPHCMNFPDLYQVIDAKTYERLHAEVRRTCISPSLLLVLFESAPASLPSTHISGWLRLVTRSGERRYIEWVLAAYALLPDA